jgi:hypothetical protein
LWKPPELGAQLPFKPRLTKGLHRWQTILDRPSMPDGTAAMSLRKRVQKNR